MIKTATGTGATVELALEDAKLKLGIKDGDEFETIEIKQPVKKVLGIFGGSPATVTLSVGKEDKPVTEKKPAKKAEKPVKTVENKEQPKAEPKAQPQPKTETKTSLPVVDTNSEEYKLVASTVEYLSDILAKMGVSDVEFKTYKTDDGFEIAFDGKGLGVAIGRKGDTLDALQHLCSLIANREHDDYIRVTLNPGGYREKRRETLVELGIRTAKKAKEKERNYTLEPMNAYERRIIHNAVQTIDGVMSWSIGENDNRRVVIGTSKDNKTYRQGGSDRGKKPYGRRSSYGRGNGGRREQYSQTPTREPRKDTADLPLYGIINK